MIKWKGILKASSAAAIPQLTTDHSLGLGVDFTKGGKPENPDKFSRTKGETKYNIFTASRIVVSLSLPCFVGFNADSQGFLLRVARSFSPGSPVFKNVLYMY